MGHYPGDLGMNNILLSIGEASGAYFDGWKFWISRFSRLVALDSATYASVVSQHREASLGGKTLYPGLFQRCDQDPL